MLYDANAVHRAFEAYESAIGPLSKRAETGIREACAAGKEDALMAAIERAGKYGARSWAYVEETLANARGSAGRPAAADGRHGRYEDAVQREGKAQRNG